MIFYDCLAFMSCLFHFMVKEWTNSRNVKNGMLTCINQSRCKVSEADIWDINSTLIFFFFKIYKRSKQCYSFIQNMCHINILGRISFFLLKKNHIVLPNWQPLWLFTYRNLAYSLKIKFEVLLCLQFLCIITIWHMTYSDDSLDQTDTLYVQYNLTFLV